MRREERHITDRKIIDDIIRRCLVCRLGLSQNNEPYIVPMNFGYDGKSLYLHGAPEGKKFSILKKNPRVCFEFDIPGDLVTNEQACKWSMKYQSVIGFGTAHIIEDLKTKRYALECVMRQYSDKNWTFPDQGLESMLVFRIQIDQIDGKERL